MERMSFLLLLTVMVCLASCKKNDSDNPSQPPVKAAVTATGTPDGNPVTQTIGAAGGTIRSADSTFELVIPAGALSANTSITIQPVTNQAPNGRRKAYRCSPDGLQFAQNITVKFHYTEEDAAKTEPEFMGIAFQLPDKTWRVLESASNDAANHVLSVAVNHFTDFTSFDLLRILPPALYLKTNESGTFSFDFTRVTGNDVLLLGELTEEPEVWKVNGITGGNSTVGTITQNGQYTAPASPPSPNPVDISCEVNISFTINGQHFNKGILLAKAYIYGHRYAVSVEAGVEITLGTGEKFKQSDHAQFTVNLLGDSGVLNDMQNSPATYMKTANGSNGCNSNIEVAGTGMINWRPVDVMAVAYASVTNQVFITFNVGEYVYPKFNIICPGGTPHLEEIPTGNLGGSMISFYDTGQQQVQNFSQGVYTLIYTITPLN